VTVVVAVPAMTMVMVVLVSDPDNNLCIRRRHQRCKEHQQ
jgi:hypothetical protein